MKRNSRLALALHTLGHMVEDPLSPRTSAQIAAHAGTNPVVVRRVLGKLRAAGLLVSEKGHSGGWRLARAAGDITLADIYTALEERLVAPDDAAPAALCSVEHAMLHHVADITRQAEEMLLRKLAETSIADFTRT